LGRFEILLGAVTLMSITHIIVSVSVSVCVCVCLPVFLFHCLLWPTGNLLILNEK